MWKIVEGIRRDYADTLIAIIDRACVGCAFVALADAVLDREDSVELAEEVRDMGRNFSGRENYCGACRAELWDIPRNQAGGLSVPWKTHNPRRLEGV